MTARGRHGAATRATSFAGLALATAMALAAAADDGAPVRHRAARGATGSIGVVHPGAGLRAKPLRDTAAPVLARVTATGGDGFAIEYLGTVEGTFDLLPLLETTESRAPDAAALGDLRVEIFSQLPPGHGTDVFGLSAPGFDLSTHYTPVLGAIALAWIAVPAVAVARRLARRAPEPPAPAPRAPSAAERLLDEVRALESRAGGDPPDAAACGRVELLLLRVLRERGVSVDDGLRDDPARALVRLRDDPASAPLVRAVEAWLHAPGPRDARAVETALAADIRRAAEEATR